MAFFSCFLDIRVEEICGWHKGQYYIYVETLTCILIIIQPVREQWNSSKWQIFRIMCNCVLYNSCVCAQSSASSQCLYILDAYANAIIRMLGMPSDLYICEHLRVSSSKRMPFHQQFIRDMLHVLLELHNLTMRYVTNYCPCCEKRPS